MLAELSVRPAEGWRDYELLDADGGERLERWGDYYLIRPDPQIIWRSGGRGGKWDDADAVYHRSSKGGGSWEFRKKLPESWTVNWLDSVKLQVRPTGFKHTGVFPEQAANWKLYAELIEKAARPVKVLNLFGYTGGATIACLKAGAEVCHVDASKGMLAQAGRNAELSSLKDKPVRFIADDCVKFVLRETRRKARYDAIIMDPPSYGRGPSGEVWKMEDNVFGLVDLCSGILSERPVFFAVNSYSAGLAPSVMGYMLASVMKDREGTVKSGEIGLKVARSGLVMPAGTTAFFFGGQNQ